jgi:hypothetical protein
MRAVPRRDGVVRSHRGLARAYTGIVHSLDTAVNNTVSIADKAIALKQIVQGINHDKYRFANAGVVWTIEDEDSDDASGLTITLENGVSVVIASVADTTSLAAAINANTELNPYIKAYMPTVTNTDSTDYRCIIESITPLYFDVTAGADVNISNVYLKLEQLEDNVTLNYEGGTINSMWEKMKFSEWTMTASATSAVNANFTMTIDESDYAVTILTGVAAPKALEAAQKLSLLGTVAVPSSTYLTGLNVAGVLTIKSIGADVTDVINTAGSDLWTVIIESSFIHEWALLDAEDMAELFPNGYGNEFQNTDLPDPNERYFLVSVGYESEAHDNTVMDGRIGRVGRVNFYIKESLMPATIAAATGEYWSNSTPNKMSDTAVEEYNIVELINWWYGSTLITEAKLAE